MKQEKLNNKNSLKQLSLSRLYALQKLLMEDIKICVMGTHIVDKNEFYLLFCELETCIQVIKEKIEFDKLICVR